MITNLGDDNDAGVGILVHARWTQSMCNIHLISNRMMVVDVSVKQYSIRIAAVYMHYDNTIATLALIHMMSSRHCSRQHSGLSKLLLLESKSTLALMLAHAKI